MHGYALLILAPHRQDAIELLDALALITDARQIRNEDVCQGLANDFILVKREKKPIRLGKRKRSSRRRRRRYTNQAHVEQSLGGTIRILYAQQVVRDEHHLLQSVQGRVQGLPERGREGEKWRFTVAI